MAIRVGTTNHDQGGIRVSSTEHSSWLDDVVVDLIRNEKSLSFETLVFETDTTNNYLDDLTRNEKNLSFEDLLVETDSSIPFYTDLEDGEWFKESVLFTLYVTSGSIPAPAPGEDPEDPLILSVMPDVTEFPPINIELGSFGSYSISANKSPVTITVSGTLPQEMELVGNTLVGGQVLEMDLYVPAFAMPPGMEIQVDGSHYATYGSALAGSYTFNVTIVGTYSGMGWTEVTYLTIPFFVRNNYSSDRDKLIVDISEAFGELGEDNEYRYFEIEGTRVTGEEFIAHQKSQGFFS